MTLTEALKSGRPFKKHENQQHWSHSGSGPWSSDDILYNGWIIEPEPPIKPVTFECKWSITEYRIIYPHNPEIAVAGFLTPFIGKRTKVTIEVIE